MTRNRWLLSLVLPAGLLILTFQNCGQVAINSPEKSNLALTTSQSIKVSVCSERTAGRAPVVIQNFFVSNITAKPVTGTLEADSDMDGLADHIEMEQGSDPQNPRSLGKILDVLCADGGASCNPTACTDSKAGFLLTDCDLRASASGGTLNGKDSDKDGLPDYHEIIRELKPAETAIASSDTDFDGQPYLIEALNGSDPNFRESAPSALWMETTEVAPDLTVPCAINQELRTYSIPALRFAPTMAFTDVNANTRNGGINLSHTAGENVFVMFYTVRNPQGVAGTTIFKTMYYIFKQSSTDPSRSLNLTDLNFTQMN